MNEIHWTALFSQTGSEIYEISKKLNRFPDTIVTNRSLNEIIKINSNLLEEYKGVWVFANKKPSVDEYKTFLSFNASKKHIITLHGWLRIIPDEICNTSCSIYNGHPGDVYKYPQLKGFNPQEKAFNLKLPTSGCIIHRVTPEVDGGEIVYHSVIPIEGLPLHRVYSDLHKMSVHSWVDFLSDKFECNLT